jgi:type IV secretory pathway VirB3-like protein
MTQSGKTQTTKYTPMGIIFALLGVALFVYFVRKAGVGQIIDGIGRLGAGFLVIVAIAGIRKVVRALAWTLCFEAPVSLRFRDAFRAVVAGEALGTLVPLGMVVSEPAKAALVRDKVPLMAGLSAIAVENLFYSLSVALFIFCGMAALLLSFPLPKALWVSSIAALVIVVCVLAAAYLVISRQRRFLSGLVNFLHARGIGRRVLENRRDRVRSLEDRVYGFYARNRARFLPILFLEACFHLAGVLEAYVTLTFISDVVAPTLLTAFILESVNRVINVVFKFVPFRMGIDEAGSGLMTHVLKLGRATGVTLAIVRKGRDVAWTSIGVALLVLNGLSPRKVAEDSRIAIANEIGKAGPTPPVQPNEG